MTDPPSTGLDPVIISAVVAAIGALVGAFVGGGVAVAGQIVSARISAKSDNRRADREAHNALLAQRTSAYLRFSEIAYNAVKLIGSTKHIQLALDEISEVYMELEIVAPPRVSVAAYHYYQSIETWAKRVNAGDTDELVSGAEEAWIDARSDFVTEAQVDTLGQGVIDHPKDSRE